MLSIPFKRCVKVHPTYAAAYVQPLQDIHSKENHLPVLNVHAGTVSSKSAGKIRNGVNWMLYCTEKKRVYSKKEGTTFTFYLNFITLTLPSDQRHSDEFLKEFLLTPFLEWMARTQGCKMWLWKAESQTNGNIHFHITGHVFIHWKSIRKKWNVLLAKYGYCKVFQDGTNDKGNAATQIKAAKNPEQVGGYLASYIGKDDRLKLKIKKPKGLPQFSTTKKVSVNCRDYDYSPHSVLKRYIDGRLWSCSYNLSRINVLLDEELMCSTSFQDCSSDVASLSEQSREEKYYTLLFYRHLKFKKVGMALGEKIFETLPKITERKYYTVESLFE